MSKEITLYQDFPYPNLQKLPIIGKKVGYIDRLVGELGLQGGFKQVIHETGSEIEVIGQNGKTKDVLTNNGVLVIGNHPFDAESILLLGTLPDRPDAMIIGATNQMGMGENLKTHIIPVCVVNQEQGSNLKLSVRLARNLHMIPKIDLKEGHVKNIQNIAFASNYVSNGHEVVLFPEGPRGKEGKWLKGIGHLIHGVQNANTYLVMAFIQGTSNMDVFRLIPHMSTLLPKGKIIYSLPISMSALKDNGATPNEITSTVQTMYHKWVSEIITR